jgi:hypothetical protein
MELAVIAVGAEALGMLLVSAVEVAPDEVGQVTAHSYGQVNGDGEEDSLGDVVQDRVDECFGARPRG